MKFQIFTICCILATLKQNIESAAVQNQKIKRTNDIELEEKDVQGPALVDSSEKGEHFNVSFMKTHSDHKQHSCVHKKNPSVHKKYKSTNNKKKQLGKGKNNKRHKPQEVNNNAMKSSNKVRRDIGNNRIDDDEHESSSSSESVENKQRTFDKNFIHSEEDLEKKQLVRRTLGGSVEDETVEDNSDNAYRRALDVKRKFANVYRYENEPLRQMLLWLVLNTMNPLVTNSIKASKGAVDRYVKSAVTKAGGQAALQSTDYSSLRFDKDRIMFYCGGQMYVYNTIKDSKICYNGQVYEVRLI